MRRLAALAIVLLIALQCAVAHDVRDVALADGRVRAVEPRAEAAPGVEVIEARGLLVTPGLIDLHVHVFYGASHYGIEPDPHCLATGVTTVIDAGSAGALTFPAVRPYVIEVSRARILPLVHLRPHGTLGEGGGGVEDGRVRGRGEDPARTRRHPGLRPRRG